MVAALAPSPTPPPVDLDDGNAVHASPFSRVCSARSPYATPRPRTYAGREAHTRTRVYTHTQTTQTKAHTRHSIGCQAIQGIHSSVALSIDYGASMFTVVHECVTYIRASDHRAGNMCDMRGNMGDAGDMGFAVSVVEYEYASRVGWGTRRRARQSVS